MLKRLKRNIILINMALVGSILILVLSFNCYNSWSNAKKSLVDSLTQTIMVMRDVNPFENHNKGQKPQQFKQEREDLFLLQYYCIFTINMSGKQIDEPVSTIELEDSVIHTVIQQALKSDKTTDILWGEGLIYVKLMLPNDMGMNIIISENNYLTHALFNSIFLSVSIGLIALVILFFISMWLSSYAIKPVETAWEQQKQFIADASHELKTPLTVLLANYNIIMNHPTETVQSQIKWLESSEEVAQHMKYLINEMLFLAKSDANRIQLVFSKVNLSEVVEEVLIHFEPVAYEKEVFIDYSDENETAIWIESDRSLLVQLLHILMDNAVKYSDNNTQIQMALTQTSGKVIFSVTNTGQGIAKEDLPHVFERFYRTDKARGEGGYGLGLAIADRMVQQLHGKISVASDGVRKTTFFLEFHL